MLIKIIGFFTVALLSHNSLASLVCRTQLKQNSNEEIYLFDNGQDVTLGQKKSGQPLSKVGKYYLEQATQDPVELNDVEFSFLQQIFPGLEWHEMDLMSWTFRTFKGGGFGQQNEMIIADIQAYNATTNNAWERYILLDGKNLIKCE